MMKNFESNIISNKGLISVIGGRRVEKIDVDGDGKWDIKMVYNDDGSLRKIKGR